MARPAISKSILRRLLAPAIALLATAGIAGSGALERLDRGWHDTLQVQLAPAALADPQTAIVLIDEYSMEQMGAGRWQMRWPWRRIAFAGIIASLHRAGAREIIVDLAFVEESPDAAHDAILGAVAAGMPNVTLASLGEKTPSFWTDEFRANHAALFQKPRWGSARAQPDEDGVYRHYPVGDSLIDAALGRAGDPANITPRLVRWRGTLKETETRLGVPVLPAVGFAQVGIDWLAEITTEAVDFEPATLVTPLATKPLPDAPIFEQVRGRTVFVGANAAAAFDYIATPAASPEPGVLLHWNAWQNFAGDEFLSAAGPWASAVGVLLVVGVIATAGWRGIGMRRPAISAFAATVFMLGASALAFDRGVWFAPAAPVAGAAITFTAVAVDSFRRERARKSEIQGWFGAYVSPAVVKRLVEDPDALKLGGERREVSVFFCDLAGFTTMSERLPADRLVSVVNTCLDELSAPLFEQGGYLDKYIGDAIMAVFGAPEALPNHALAAVRAALECQRRLPALNERLAREHEVTIGVRFGIATGEAVVGNVGSERKKNFTVLGDTVNLASRLEGANKEFHTQILLGPLTAARVADEIATRPVARLRVKGKTRAVEVHEPLGAHAGLDETTHAFVRAYREGFDAWCAGAFAQAADAFGRALALRPDDFLTTRYRNEARRWAAATPPADWEPILNLESK